MHRTGYFTFPFGSWQALADGDCFVLRMIAAITLSHEAVV